MSQCHAKTYDKHGDPHRCTEQTDGVVCAKHLAEAREYKALDCGLSHYAGCACHEARHRKDLGAAYERGYLAGLQSYLQGSGK